MFSFTPVIWGIYGVWNNVGFSSFPNLLIWYTGSSTFINKEYYIISANSKLIQYKLNLRQPSTQNDYEYGIYFENNTVFYWTRYASNAELNFNYNNFIYYYYALA